MWYIGILCTILCISNITNTMQRSSLSKSLNSEEQKNENPIKLNRFFSFEDLHTYYKCKNYILAKKNQQTLLSKNQSLNEEKKNNPTFIKDYFFDNEEKEEDDIP